MYKVQMVLLLLVILENLSKISLIYSINSNKHKSSDVNKESAIWA